MSLSRRFSGLLAAAWSSTLGAAAANADQPVSWQMNFQAAATPVMERVQDFNTLISIIIIAINWFVIGLLIYVLWRFNAKRNPVPSKTTHNTLVEIVWTMVPIIIVVLIVVRSFSLLYYQDRAVNAEMTIKAIGHQWYWTYEYPDHGDLTFDALMIADEEIKGDQVRLLETDNRIVVPVDTAIRVLVTADDVIHAWTVPPFGIKIDAVPGRLNETWFQAVREGVFYGQCSELCGVRHGFMPITVEVVSKAAFADWIVKAKQEFAYGGAPAATTVAATLPYGAQ